MGFIDRYEVYPKKKARLQKNLDRRFALVFVPLSAVAVSIAAFMAFTRVAGPTSVPAAATLVSAEGDRVIVPVPQADDVKARFYCYRSANGKSVRFFVARGNDGELHVGLDACGVSYPRCLGFVQSGCDVVCNACGVATCIADVERPRSRCQPLSLPYRHHGETVLVAVNDLDSATRYFPSLGAWRQ